jgi:hypothetical protein
LLLRWSRWLLYTATLDTWLGREHFQRQCIREESQSNLPLSASFLGVFGFLGVVGVLVVIAVPPSKPERASHSFLTSLEAARILRKLHSIALEVVF